MVERVRTDRHAPARARPVTQTVTRLGPTPAPAPAPAPGPPVRPGFGPAPGPPVRPGFGPAPGPPVRPGFGRPRAERSISPPERPTAAAAAARAATRFTITGLGGISATVQPHQVRGDGKGAVLSRVVDALGVFLQCSNNLESRGNNYATYDNFVVKQTTFSTCPS